MSIDDSMDDIHETEIVERFMNNSCWCKTGPKGSPCSSGLTEVTIKRCRAENFELSRDELDLVILAQLRACQILSLHFVYLTTRQQLIGP